MNDDASYPEPAIKVIEVIMRSNRYVINVDDKILKMKLTADE